MSPRIRTRRRKRILGLLLSIAMLLSVGSFVLADTGTTTFSITPPAGLGASGAVADFTTTSGTFTRPNGNAQIDAGIQVGRIDVAAGFATGLRLNMAWLNSGEAAQVLNNPNAAIWVGVYYPIYQGTCSGTTKTVEETRATMDYNGTSHCSQLDSSALGKLVSDGKLVLTRELISGQIQPKASDASVSACGVVDTNTTWCRPSGADASKNILFVGATIVTPGGKPQGQVNNVSDLKFFFNVRGQT